MRRLFSRSSSIGMSRRMFSSAAATPITSALNLKEARDWVAHVNANSGKNWRAVTSDTITASPVRRLLMSTLPDRQQHAIRARILPDNHCSDDIPVNWYSPSFQWCYCLPAQPAQALSADGYSGEHEPPKPFSKRMWAGGKIEWHHDVQLDTKVQLRTQIKHAALKDGKSGPIVFVTVEHSIHRIARHFEAEAINGESQRLITEEQQYAYRAENLKSLPPATATGSGSATPTPTPPSTANEPTRPLAAGVDRLVIIPTDIMLLRYSALTFNAHRIHWDIPYSQREEGYASTLVHGPLTATLLLNHLAQSVVNRDAIAQFNSGPPSPSNSALPKWKRITSFTYKARAPMLCDNHSGLVLDAVKQSTTTTATGSTAVSDIESYALTASHSTSGVVIMDGVATVQPVKY